MDRLIQHDPEMAHELMNVARLQKQVILLKKSNNSLRSKENQKYVEYLATIDKQDWQIRGLDKKVSEKDQEIKLLSIKLKELVMGEASLTVTERDLLKAENALMMTGSSRMPATFATFQKKQTFNHNKGPDRYNTQRNNAHRAIKSVDESLNNFNDVSTVRSN